MPSFVVLHFTLIDEGCRLQS